MCIILQIMKDILRMIPRNRIWIIRRFLLGFTCLFLLSICLLIAGLILHYLSPERMKLSPHIEVTYKNESRYKRPEIFHGKAQKFHNMERMMTQAQMKVLDYVNKHRKPISYTTKQNLKDQVTIVTAYFDLGHFKKDVNTMTPEIYRKWMRTFRYLTNPVVAYLETDEDIMIFRNIRRHLPANMTIVHRLNRDKLWAFQLEARIAKIFNQPSYPKFEPNTVRADYSSAMHAKYELMQFVSKENPFDTKYIAWLDIGLFRELASDNSHNFSLYIPPDLNEENVAYCEVFPQIHGIFPKHIFRGNYVWVCGCFFISTMPVMQKWTQEYKLHTEAYLSVNLMNTDQQVLYAMLTSGGSIVNMQTYKVQGSEYNPWFYLGYLCKEEGERKNKQRS